MSISLGNAWDHQFHDMIRLTYQQKTSLVEGQIDPIAVHRDVKAAIDYHERLGNLILSQGGVRHGPSVIFNPEHSRRACTLVTAEGGILLSDLDQVRALVDPKNAYRDTLVNAALRSADKFIIDAAIGSASTVTTGGSGQFTFGSQAMLAGYQIGAASAMDLTRIIQANELLSKAGVPSGAQNRLMLYSPGQLRDIMAITQASSSDFTKNQIHDKGTINGLAWEGFTWIEIPDVVDPATTVLQRMLPVPSYRQCIAMSRDAVGLSIGQQFNVEITQRSDLRNEYQVYLKMTMNAVRLFEGGVVEVRALEN